jgi:protein AATF/BFR2
MEGDPELIDDSEFYQQLLKEFLESCDRGASGLFIFSYIALIIIFT